MHNHEAPAHRKLILRSLLICWLIILGGYLLIRMVFLVCGLQLHLTAQGACLVLLPTALGRCIYGGAARIGNRCFTRLVFCSRLLSRNWRCISSARICAGSVPSVSQQSWRRSEGSNRMRYSLHGCPCGTQSTCCFLTGHTFFAASPSLHSAFWACPSCKSGRRMNYKQDVGAAECCPVSDCLSCNQYYLQA